MLRQRDIELNTDDPISLTVGFSHAVSDLVPFQTSLLLNFFEMLNIDNEECCYFQHHDDVLHVDFENLMIPR